MNDFLKGVEIFGIKELWLLKVVAVITITIVLHFVVSYLLAKVLRGAEKTRSHWDDALLLAAIKPLPTVVWVVGLTVALSIVGSQNQDVLLEFAPILREVGITVCFAWFCWRLISFVSEKFLTRQSESGVEVDHTTVDALSKLGHLIVSIAALLTIMQTLGFSVSGILAAGGIGGIAIGFAAKDLLANFFGGLTIYLDRPFNVGDWIRSPDRDIEGVVEMISWRHTRIRRFNKNPIYVPNSAFVTIAVENPSRMSNRRIKEMIGIRYDDIAVMADIVKDVKAMLQTHEDIDPSKTLIVNFTAFSASSVDFMIYTFTKTVVWTEYHEIRQDVLLKVADIVAKHNAEMAFPTQTIHMAAEG